MSSKARNLSDFISDPAIDSTELGDGSVTTAKLGDQAVTPAKLHNTLDLSSKTVTLATDGISGNSVHGGVISDFASTGIDDNAVATAITIDSSGNVGVGTSNPQHDIHMGNQGAQIGFGATDASRGGPFGLTFYDDDTAASAGVGMRLYYRTGTESITIEDRNQTQVHKFGKDGNVVFNEPGNDADFRVESVNNSAMLVVNAGNDGVGIGTSNPDNTLHVKKAHAGTVAGDPNAPLVVESNVHSYVHLLTPNTGNQGFLFGDPDNKEVGALLYVHSNNSMIFRTNASERMRITSGGNVGIGETPSPTYKLEVSSPNGSQRIRVGTLQNNYNTATFEAITSHNVPNATSGWMKALYGGGLALGTSSYTKANGDSGNFNNLSSEVAAERMRITSGGFVGIKNSSPSALLQVGTNANSTDWSDRMIFGATAASTLDTAFGGSAAANNRARVWIAGGGEGQASLGFYNSDSGGTGFRISTVGGRLFVKDVNDTSILGFGPSGSNSSISGEYDLFTDVNSYIGGLNMSIYDGSGVYVSKTGDGNHSIFLRRGYRYGGSGGVVENTIEYREYGSHTFWTGGSIDGMGKRMTIDQNGNIGAPTGTNIYSASDERLKRNIAPLTSALSKVNSLRGVSFEWREDFLPDEPGELYGFVAQEVQDVDTNLISSFGSGTVKIGDPEDPDEVIENALTVNEKFIVPLLVEAIKEQQTIIEQLKARLDAAGL